MPRVKLLELPEYELAHQLQVRVTDLNYGGHLATEALVGLLHEARARWMAQLGFRPVGVSEAGVGLIIADLLVSFRQEAFAFDTLRIEGHIGELTEKSLRLFQRVAREGRPVALAETGLVAFDYEQRRPVALPDKFLAGVRQIQAGWPSRR